MHELSIAESMIDVIEESLGEVQLLKSIDITVGPLSGVAADALQFCFNRVAEERGFGCPELRINTPKANLICHTCGTEYSAKEFFEGCPKCASMDREIRSGRELKVDSVELTDD